MVYFFICIAELILLFILSQRITSAVFLLFHTLFKSQKVATIFFALLFYPGVLIHELAHYLSAMLLMVPVGNMEFTPVLDNGGMKLGSVAIGKTDPIRRMLIGVAPLLIGVGILLTSLFYAQTSGIINSFWKGFLAVYIIFVIGNTMFSSKKDLEGTFELLAALAIVGLALYFFGIRIPIEKIFTPFTESLLLQAIYYLAIPIGINIVLLLLARLIKIRV